MTAPESMIHSFEVALEAHRPELLRHCYRMLGSFAEAEDAVQEALLNAWRAQESYAGAAPLRHWLFRIATNTCLNLSKGRRRRSLPELMSDPSAAGASVGEATDVDDWVTPAPDAALALDAASALEERESIALAFVALLQRLPERQRAVLLLKDGVGLSTEEISAALELSVPAVSSALHRARRAMPLPRAVPTHAELPAEVLREYVRCWEMRDLPGLLRLLHPDVVFTMPPFAAWFRGVAAVEQFLAGERFAAFWSSSVRVLPTRANGQSAIVFYRDGGLLRHSIQLLRSDGTRFTELVNLIGPSFLHGFAVPEISTERFCERALSRGEEQSR
jgi:RNA polymerase sigma-70 factor (ECF subfamily)